MDAPDKTTAAFLVRLVDYGESDRIVTLFTRDYGKISALARGARKSRRRFGGALEPFCLLEVTLASHARGLWRLGETTLVAAYPGLASSLARLGAAARILELAREVVPEHEPDPAMFELLEQALPALSRADEPHVAATAAAASLRVLALAGFELRFTDCSVCGAPVPKGARVRFDPWRGGVVCTPCGGGPIGLAAAAVRGLLALLALPLSRVSEAGVDAPRVAQIEEAIDAFVRHHLGKPLRSSRFRAS
ncbi:MAG: DNA repair protein RecO [Deltaproteobacteria bacterium]|nr:DNA repair protein RecO [Deltaproteobacteria bacterium]